MSLHAPQTPVSPTQPHSAPSRAPRSWAPALSCAALLALACYGAARLPWWPLVLAALGAVVLALVLEQVRTMALASPPPRHPRGRGRRRRDRHAALVVRTPWELA